MVKPYTVIGEWRWGPKGRYATNIGESLTAITRELGYVPFANDEIKRNEKAAWFDYNQHAEVRMTAELHSEGTGWHQDGDTSTKDMNCALVLWANRDPTQFKFRGISPEIIWQPEPFEIVIANNLYAYHRRPPGVSGKRFIFRHRVTIA